MKIYNPKEWFHAVVNFPKSDTFLKLLPFIIFMGAYSALIAYFELEYLNLSSKSWLKEITTVHSLLGFVISMLLVFRTNSAYDRWWEGRKQWGALTNASRNLAIKLNGMLAENDSENRDFFKQMIPMYAKTLFSFLRSDYTKFMLDEDKYFNMNLIEKHGPNHIANLMYQRITLLHRQKIFDSYQMIILDKEFEEFTNICGACERIKNTPIPYSYSSFIKKFIVLYVITLPIGLVFSMGYFTAIAVPFIFYVLASLELIAETIEEPFGTDLDDLPIEQITMNIEKHVAEIIN
ncbi:bestrophin family protein [Faecalibacter bovis]|uniref:Bestrophin n=1 Tax=Faecalibacter bovis TaxID=2898187 RepID=A0ABX7XAZ2_9FLAO|nr:bestrophin family ion channel [Faecalibacter bovis]MBS7332558.1 hypothetical protein [Weeksellaceae bacterium]QTV04959.1 hypothetical protein J9309_09180 [Faecalibacter bovis]